MTGLTVTRSMFAAGIMIECTVSVVENAGRNLVEDTRKTDKRDDGKDADPIREAHGLRPHYRGEHSPQSESR
jgi:hypothetical protein